jgi:hypothetical protein
MDKNHALTCRYEAKHCIKVTKWSCDWACVWNPVLLWRLGTGLAGLYLVKDSLDVGAGPERWGLEGIEEYHLILGVRNVLCSGNFCTCCSPFGHLE